MSKHAYWRHGSFSSHSSICYNLMEHIECFLSFLPQTLPLIRAVEVSLSGHSPTADFTCTSRSFLQGKLQNLATLQKVSRHRKQAGQLWLSGSCLVLHIINFWHFYLKKSLMFPSDNIFSIENPWPISQYTNIAKVHGQKSKHCIALVWWILFLFLWTGNDGLLFDVGSVAAIVPEGLSLFGNVRYDSSGRLASSLEGLVLSALEDKPFLMVG